METTTTTPTDAAPETTETKTDTGLATAGTDAVTNDTIKDAAREVIRKHKFKVSGEEVEVDDNELKRGYSMSKAAAKELQDAKRMRSQAEQFISMMKDPTKLMDALTKLGHDPRKLSESYLAQVLEDEVMDPKDKELKTLRNTLQQKEAADKQRDEEIKAKRDEAVKQQYMKQYEAEFIEVLSKSKLPQTKETVGEMAKYIGMAAKQKIKITADEAARLVQQDMEARTAAIFKGSDPETIIKLLGEETVNKIRQGDVAKLRDPNAGLRDTQPAGEKRERRDPSKRLTPHEWRRFNRGF